MTGGFYSPILSGESCTRVQVGLSSGWSKYNFSELGWEWNSVIGQLHSMIDIPDSIPSMAQKEENRQQQQNIKNKSGK